MRKDKKVNALSIVTWDKLRKAHEIYLKEEPRDAVYRVSTKLINENWNRNKDISNALGVLLLIWNSAFYRYGSLDYELIENSISKTKVYLDTFRRRDIISFVQPDKERIESIYGIFLNSLRSIGKLASKNAGKISYSPVSVGKALHLLCPNFFPLWDNKIAKSYDCMWKSSKSSFDNYWKFMMISKEQIRLLYSDNDIPPELKRLNPLKLIDEYNYARFTLGLTIN